MYACCNSLLQNTGIARSKSIQTRFVRDNRIHYTSLHLLFLNITPLLFLMCLSSEICGDLQVSYLLRWWDGQFDSIACIITGYFCTLQKASVGMHRMYSRCDYPLQISFVSFLILPSLLHPSFYSIVFIVVPILFLVQFIK